MISKENGVKQEILQVLCHHLVQRRSLPFGKGQTHTDNPLLKKNRRSPHLLIPFAFHEKEKVLPGGMREKVLPRAAL